jgi:hypothetical protein
MLLVKASKERPQRLIRTILSIKKGEKLQERKSGHYISLEIDVYMETFCLCVLNFISFLS